jgi:hypothetical protein
MENYHGIVYIGQESKIYLKMKKLWLLKGQNLIVLHITILIGMHQLMYILLH